MLVAPSEGKNARSRGSCPGASSPTTPTAPSSHRKLASASSIASGALIASSQYGLITRPRRASASAEQLLHSLEEGTQQRAALSLRGRLEGLQRLALRGIQLVGHLEEQTVAGVTVAALAQAWHTAAPELQDLTGLTACRNLQRRGPRDHRHAHLGAEDELREGQREIAVGVGAVTGEELVRLDPHKHVQVTRGPARETAGTLARNS